MLKQFFIDFFAEGWKIITEDIISVLPDVMGYVTIFCGGYIMLSPLLNRDIMRPVGIFVGVGIVVVSILGVS